jgi:hypothetical protein
MPEHLHGKERQACTTGDNRLFDMAARINVQSALLIQPYRARRADMVADRKMRLQICRS